MIYDPKKKFVLRGLLEEFIYKPAESKLKKKLNAIMDSHSIDDPHRSMAFMYKGEVYAPEDYRSPYKITLLTRRLYSLMDEWKVENQKLQEEKEGIVNYLTCILNESESIADLFALLPECLHPALAAEGLHQRPNVFSTQQIEAINQQHAAAIQKLKERLVINLIT